jgi:YD repeat-containing protein
LYPSPHTIIGGDCASTAYAQFANIYGTASEYKFYFTAPWFCVVEGYGPGRAPVDQGGQYLFHGSGQAELICDVPGTTQSNGECVNQDDAQRPHGPSSCSANSSSGSPSGGDFLVGNPLVAMAQRKVEHAVDFSTTGPFPLSFEQFYGRYQHSLWGDHDRGRLGVNWRSNFDAILTLTSATPAPGSEARITLPDGHDLSFLYQGGAFVPSYFYYLPPAFLTYAPRVGATESLTYAGGTYQLRTDDDRTWIFDSTGNLQQIIHRGGYVQTLNYANGVNTSVTDNLGRSLAFIYDSGGRISQVTAPDGSTFTYQYQVKTDGPLSLPPEALSAIGFNNSVLISVTEPGPSSPKITYVYDDPTARTVGSTSVHVNLFGLTGVIDERGTRYATFGYDANGDATSTQHAGGVDLYTLSYDATNKMVTITNPLAKQTILTFSDDSSNNRTLTSVQGQPSAHCPLSNSTIEYDSNKFVSAIVDEEGRRTAFVNNARGLPTSITRGAGAASAITTTFSWNDN